MQGFLIETAGSPGIAGCIHNRNQPQIVDKPKKPYFERKSKLANTTVVIG